MLNRISELYARRVEHVLSTVTEETDHVQWDVAPVTEMYYINHEGEAKVDNLLCVWIYSFEPDDVVLEARAAFPIRTATVDIVDAAIKRLWEAILVERLEHQFNQPE